MSIGMFDADMAGYTLVPFNLELMKLSAYYKKKKQVVVLSPKFTPERHQRFFARKDFDDGINSFPIQGISNLDYGGHAFSGERYTPLPTEIEKQIPDTSLYLGMENTILSAPGRVRENKKIYQNMMTAEHCRLSLDGKTIWEDYPSQFKMLKTARNLMLHDYDLGAIDGSFEEVKRLLARARTDGWATRIGMKFPPVISEGQEMLNWISLLPNSTFYSLRYEGIMDDDCFDEFIGQVRDKAIWRQLDYYVTTKCATDTEFLEKHLQRLYRQVVKSRSYRVFFSLKYEENFFFDSRWERVLDLINFYHNSMSSIPQARYFAKISKDTMYDFAKHTYDEVPAYYKKFMTRQEIRELFAFVREKHPALFEDFYEFNINRLEG